MNMKNLLPFTNDLHSRYQKSKIPKERRVFILWLLAACVLFLPHANVEPERGFSIKSLLRIHVYSNKDETIVALRLVKAFTIERGGIEEIKVTQELLRSCDRARERYGAFLEQQRKVEEQMKLARVKEELAKQTKDAASEVQNEIRFLKKGIEVAETSVEEGNHELGVAMKGKTKSRQNSFMPKQDTMGLKKKTDLNKDLRKLEEKKMKLCIQQILLYFIVS